MVWEFYNEHPRTTLGNIVRKHLGDEHGNDIDRLMSAAFSMTHGKFHSPAEVRSAFTMRGRRFLSPEQAKKIYQNLIPKKMGGASTTAESAAASSDNAMNAEIKAEESIQKLQEVRAKLQDVSAKDAKKEAVESAKAVADAAKESVRQHQLWANSAQRTAANLGYKEKDEYSDSAINKFGNMLRRAMAGYGDENKAVYVVSMIQTVMAIIQPFVFFLKEVESLPLVGPVADISLDVLTMWLPLIASGGAAAIQTLAMVLSFIPGAGLIGSVLGWLFSVIFLGMGSAIAFSRTDFSKSLELASGMVPALGPTLMKGIASGDAVGAKFLKRKDEIMQALGDIVEHLQAAVSAVGQQYGDKVPTINLDKFKELRGKYVGNLPENLKPGYTPPDEEFDEDPKQGGRFTRRRRSINKKQWRRKTTKRRQ